MITRVLNLTIFVISVSTQFNSLVVMAGNKVVDKVFVAAYREFKTDVMMSSGWESMSRW